MLEGLERLQQLMDEVNETEVKIESRLVAFKKGFDFKSGMCEEMHSELKKNITLKKTEVVNGEKGKENDALRNEDDEALWGKLEWKGLNLKFIRFSSSLLILDLPLCLTTFFINSLVSFTFHSISLLNIC